MFIEEESANIVEHKAMVDECGGVLGFRCDGISPSMTSTSVVVADGVLVGDRW